MKKVFIHILLLVCCCGLTTCTPEFTMEDVLFTVEVQPDDAALGSITFDHVPLGSTTGNGKYYRYKAEIAVEAKPIGKNEFIEWSDGVKDNPRKIIVTSDTIITAIFQSIPKYTITVRSNDTNTGVVSGGGTYYRDEKVTLYASPRYNCEFVRWDDGNTSISRTITVSQNQTFTAYFEKDASLPSENGHDYVDLGLPSGILWATCNVGANYPEDYGNYYAWGEIETKINYSAFSRGEYTWGVLDTEKTPDCGMTKYNQTDGKMIIDAADDAATANWGGQWRMPTPDEIEELENKCTWVWTTINNVNGCKIVGPNGKSIFLPAAGNYFRTEHEDEGKSGYYWSSSLSWGYGHPYYAATLEFTSYSPYSNVDFNVRYKGMSVRPVFGEMKTYTITVTANDDSMGSVTGGGTYDANTQVTLIATPVSDAYKFVKWSDENTDNPRLVSVKQDETYIAHFAPIETNGYEYVDLGLPSGLLWATCNVGATKPEEYGDYFAWGETEPKEDYSEVTYRWCNGSSTQLTKYCYDRLYGFVDNKRTLEPIDDAATANWGGVWRMPTQAEQVELGTECTWIWTTLNGVEGCKVFGPNGNSIFLSSCWLLPRNRSYA